MTSITANRRSTFKMLISILDVETNSPGELADFTIEAPIHRFGSGTEIGEFQVTILDQIECPGMVELRLDPNFSNDKLQGKYQYKVLVTDLDGDIHEVMSDMLVFK